MPGFTCNSCNAEFEDAAAQKNHYKSEWHRYNLRRKVAGVPGVTEALFDARQQALVAAEKNMEKNRMVYSCTICNKEYRSAKAYEEHLRSKAHMNAPGNLQPQGAAVTAVIRPLPERPSKAYSRVSDSEEDDDDDDDEDEWEEVENEEELDRANDMVEVTSESLKNLDINGGESNEAELHWDASRCFICDARPDGTIESCVIHMHKMHGFFIPDAEYLADPKGLLSYLGIKVAKDFSCLYCNERRQPFQSLEAVRKHMVSKNHCKLRYGDGEDEDEDGDLDEFYDYSSSYADDSGMKIVPTQESLESTIELGFGNAELVIKKPTESGFSCKILGSREYLKYYKQRPRPTAENEGALSRALVSRYKSMGLATVQSKQVMLRRKTIRKMQKFSAETMRTKVGLKHNVIRNLPKNVTF